MNEEGKLRIFEGNMDRALRSWIAGGGKESREPAIVEMPFEELMRKDERDQATLAEVQRLHTRWQELQIVANETAADAKASAAQKRAAQMEADTFWRKHESEFSLLATLESSDHVNDYDWQQRALGAKLVFRWILAEGFHPLKVMKRLYAVGRAMGVSPFTQLTMEEQGKMFSETKANVSWRMKALSGLISLRGMVGRRLAGQKSPHAAASYSRAQEGNTNRAGGTQGTFLPKLKVARQPGRRAGQASFLRRLHVPKTDPPNPHES